MHCSSELGVKSREKRRLFDEEIQRERKGVQGDEQWSRRRIEDDADVGGVNGDNGWWIRVEKAGGSGGSGRKHVVGKRP